MKVEYLENINEYGEHLVKIFDFDKEEAMKFKQAIQETIIDAKRPLVFSTLDFIQHVNCLLVFLICETDEGVSRLDNKTFFCALTIDGYKQMVRLVEPYCNKNTRSYQYLYDIDTEIDLLFSPLA